MSVAHSPSKFFRISNFVRDKIANKVPFLRNRFRRQRIAKLNQMAGRAASCNISSKVIASGWATKTFPDYVGYREITSELVEVCKTVDSFVGGIPVADHWSRRYEYPYAIINSILPIHKKKDFRILDCGSGMDPIQFYLAIKGYQVYPLDLDLTTLESVACLKNTLGLKNLHPTYGNILDLPFPDSYFDRVLSISVIEHVIDDLKQNISVVFRGLLNELLRVLKPNGLMILTFDVNMNPEESDFRLYFYEYEMLCEILGLQSTAPPLDRLISSETMAGSKMGKDLCVYCMVLKRRS
jgi:SAM-dependent methyltransferase